MSLHLFIYLLYYYWAYWSLSEYEARLSTRDQCKQGSLRYMLKLLMLFVQGIGRLFRCLCSPDVDDDEPEQRIKWEIKRCLKITNTMTEEGWVWFFWHVWDMRIVSNVQSFLLEFLLYNYAQCVNWLQVFSGKHLGHGKLLMCRYVSDSLSKLSNIKVSITRSL